MKLVFNGISSNTDRLVNSTVYDKQITNQQAEMINSIWESNAV